MRYDLAGLLLPDTLALQVDRKWRGLKEITFNSES